MIDKKLIENPVIASGIEILSRLRVETDINMVAKVRELLYGAGLAKQASEHYDSNLSIQKAETLCPEAQRFFLNQYWYDQLSLFPQETIEHRFYLINTGLFEHWLFGFETKILPFLISKSLPQSLPKF